MPPTQQIRPYEGIINHHCPLGVIRVLFQWWGGIGGGGTLIFDDQRNFQIQKLRKTAKKQYEDHCPPDEVARNTCSKDAKGGSQDLKKSKRPMNLC